MIAAASTDFGQGISNKIYSSAIRCIRHTVTHVTQIAEDYSNDGLEPKHPRTAHRTCQLKSSRAVMRTYQYRFVTSYT